MKHLLFLMCALGVYLLAARYVERVERSRRWPPDATYPIEAATSDIQWTQDRERTLMRLRGRAVLLYFWGPGDDGADLLPSLNRLHRAYAPHGLEMIGLYKSDEDEWRAALDKKCRRYGVTWRQFSDHMHEVDKWWEHWHVTSVPSVVVLDREGKTAWGPRPYPSPGTEEAIVRVLGLSLPSPAPGVVVPQIEGRLLYAGRPVSEFSTRPARFQIRPALASEAVQRLPETHYDPSTSSFKILNIEEGSYHWDVRVEDPSRDPGLCFMNLGRRTFGVPGVPLPRMLDVPLQRNIHLIKPVDNFTDLKGQKEMLAHPTVFLLEWDPILEADRYEFMIHRRRLQSREEESWELYWKGSTTGAQVEVARRLEEGFEYRFILRAYREIELLGLLRVNRGVDTWTEDYRFLVAPSR
ncbi:MAG: TlpA family protein disulfide reductase [Planctomycetes bacterium]|nr:TlpA family protein disulfide reductase [Planctomycetota bacterium]